MTQYIKRIKFSRTLREFEYVKGKPTRAFLKDIMSEDGLIKKDFHWLEKKPKELEKLKRGDKIMFEIKSLMQL